MSIRLLNSSGFKTATVYEFYLDEFLLKFILKNPFKCFTDVILQCHFLYFTSQ